ncbi:uncharacterized protein LOC134242170 isoform X3 [Saccostrea cucullata]|uniref:uncharacterized protein LOC134242170 isoform X3 n=1 Tax=Saccostrea cuccullata TaxID=36930 RepID=UPI002ED520C2
MNFNFIIILLGISFSQIVMERSVVIRDVALNWTEARTACRGSKSHLLNFFEMKNRLEYLKGNLKETTKYWVADTWIPKLLFVKGCQSKTNILSTRIFEGNILSECVKYCENQSYNTIGIQGYNCSCIVEQNLPNLESNSCDMKCAWTNISCRAEKRSFAVYQLANDVLRRLGGTQFQDCVYYNTFYETFTRDDCNSELPFICQDRNGDLKPHDVPLTWMEADKNCSEEDMILANVNNETIPRRYNTKYKGNYWIGLRQSYIYQSDLESSLCSFVQKYNSLGDLTYSKEDCSEKNSNICLEDPVRTASSSKTVQKVSNSSRNTDGSTTRDENIETTNEISTQTVIGGDANYQMKLQSESAKHAQERRSVWNEGVLAGVIVGIIGTVALVVLVVICLFFRSRNKNPRSKYQSPTVIFSSTPRRDSKLPEDKSVKSSPIKPVRRSKKSNPGSMSGGTAYENIVLTLEDPKTISRVVSSSSTAQKQDTKDVENSYDVMGAGKNNNPSGTSQSVYGFSAPDNEYDVMDRGTRRNEEMNPDYDHM